MFAEAIASILDDRCTPQAVRVIEGGASAAPLAQAIEEAGFFALLAPEDQGGAGAGWADFHDVVSLCGARAVPVPLAQTMAARALVRDAARLPGGLITFAPSLVRGDGGTLTAPTVPFGRVAGHVMGALDGALLLPTAGAQATATGVHGQLAASLAWPGGAGTALETAVPPDRLQATGALLHAALLAGAMKRVFDMTIAHANERVQFGKPIGKFQAIQHQLSVMAEHVAASAMAADAAFQSHGGALPQVAACAVAKARTSEAAQRVASIAHAVHGAIGVSGECDLQLYTRRLHEWRTAHGSERYWNGLLGRLYIDGGRGPVNDFVQTLC